MIDPTARISPTATIADDAEIGPNVTVGDGAVIGSGTRVMANAVVGPWTTIGRNNTIHYGAIVGHDPQDFGYNGEESYAVIGDGNIIREYATIHRGNRAGTTTVIGSNNFFMIQSHVAHNCEIGNNVILAGGALLAGHVIMDDRAIISGNCVVHQFCRIGRFAITGGCSKIVQDVPPFMIADGNPAEVRGINQVGLERAGYPPERIKPIKEAFRLIYRSKMNTGQALEAMRERLTESAEVQSILEFIATSERGIIR